MRDNQYIKRTEKVLKLMVVEIRGTDDISAISSIICHIVSADDRIIAAA